MVGKKATAVEYEVDLNAGEDEVMIEEEVVDSQKPGFKANKRKGRGFQSTRGLSLDRSHP